MMQNVPMYIILSLVLSLLSALVYIYHSGPVSILIFPLQEKMTAKLQFFREEQDAWEQSRKKEESPVA